MSLICDVGNVLVHFDQAKMLKNLSSIFNLPYNDFLKIFFRENENYELGLYSSKELYWKMIEHSSAFNPQKHEYPSFDTFKKAYTEVFSLNYEMLPILKKLKENNIQLIILSNTCKLHFDYLLNNYQELFKIFDHKILSFEIGLRKPSPSIYKEAMARATSPTFYIDDIEEFIESAKNTGLEGVRFTDAEKLLAQLKKRKIL